MTTVSNVAVRPVNTECKLTVGLRNVKIIGNLDKIYFDRLMATTIKWGLFQR